jgi:hypothetical protein
MPTLDFDNITVIKDTKYQYNVNASAFYPAKSNQKNAEFTHLIPKLQKILKNTEKKVLNMQVQNNSIKFSKFVIIQKRKFKMSAS